MKLPYVTGNKIKFNLAQDIMREFDVALEQMQADITEIQNENGEVVARNKAEQAFHHFQKPIIVSDDFWLIPGLNGFPGPYMKSVNTWFTPEDWLRLTRDLTDRRIILRQVVVYQDAHGQKLFSADIEGTLLRETRGKSPYSHSYITSFDGGEHSSAEIHARDSAESSARHHHNAWHDLGAWLAVQD
jgi:non-canonical purine NTP pyrophosphatase (RdgB/HAM1 family)